MTGISKQRLNKLIAQKYICPECLGEIDLEEPSSHNKFTGLVFHYDCLSWVNESAKYLKKDELLLAYELRVIFPGPILGLFDDEDNDLGEKVVEYVRAIDIPERQGRLRKAAARDQKGCCFYCGRGFKRTGKYRATADHKLPLSRGGKTSADNIVAACYTCNQEKGDMTENEYLIYKALS